MVVGAGHTNLPLVRYIPKLEAFEMTEAIDTSPQEEKEKVPSRTESGM